MCSPVSDSFFGSLCFLSLAFRPLRYLHGSTSFESCKHLISWSQVTISTCMMQREFSFQSTASQPFCHHSRCRKVHAPSIIKAVILAALNNARIFIFCCDLKEVPRWKERKWKFLWQRPFSPAINTGLIRSAYQTTIKLIKTFPILL